MSCHLERCLRLWMVQPRAQTVWFFFHLVTFLLFLFFHYKVIVCNLCSLNIKLYQNDVNHAWIKIVTLLMIHLFPGIYCFCCRNFLTPIYFIPSLFRSDRQTVWGERAGWAPGCFWGCGHLPGAAWWQRSQQPVYRPAPVVRVCHRHRCWRGCNSLCHEENWPHE